MLESTRRIYSIAGNPWFVVIGGICSIVGFIWHLYDRISGHPAVVSGISLTLAVSILSVGYIYSIRVRTENIALREVAGIFNEINRIYRKTLQSMFGGDSPVRDSEDLLHEEARTLKSVCQRIALIFERLTNRRCSVTIKLITQDNNSKKFAHTYVRDMDRSERDRDDRKFEVGTGRNTAFDVALQSRTDGWPAHFFSTDLDKVIDYCNERQDFRRFYKSAIVVPIRAIDHSKAGTGEESDLVGFLCVDTMSKHRLNDGYHIQIMTSLAEQMYNFLSLMRGRYTVIVEGKDNDA